MTKSIINLSAVLSIIITTLFSAEGAISTGQGHVIRGKVRTSSGQNMARAQVELQTGNGIPVNQTTTNNEGDFSFAGLTLTSYILIVSAVDYSTATEHVNFIRTIGENESGETRVAEIILNPKGASVRSAPSRTAFSQPVPVQARNEFERGIRLSREGKPDQAIDALKAALELFPDYFEAHFALGNELINAGRLDEAISELERARQLNSKDDRVYQSFGLVLMKQRKYAVAAAVFAEAARLNPSDPQALLLRGTALIDQAASLDNTSPADASERARLFDAAEKELVRAFELSGKKLAAVCLQTARLYEKKAERARAAAELELYLRLAPDTKNADSIREAIRKLRAPADEPKRAPSRK